MTSTGKKIKLGSTSNTTFDDPNAPINEHYYWVKACNGSHCSSLSDPDTGYAAGSEKIYLPLILNRGFVIIGGALTGAVP